MNDRLRTQLTWAALAVGIFLRVWYLGDQVVQGDERWTLQVALEKSPAYILTEHDSMSFSVPLALWNWLLAHTLGLSEWGIRLPVLLIGITAVPLLGLFVRRRFGAAEAAVVVWLASLSPILILYSRFARPYIGVFVASLVATAGWCGWLERRSARSGALMALGGACAIYLHLLAAPAIGTLWALAMVLDLWDRRALDATSPPTRAAWLGSAGWVGLGAAVLGLALLPSLASLLEFASEKQGVHLPTGETWIGASHLLLGTLHAPMLAWLAASAGLGALQCFRRAPRLAALFGLMWVAQAAAITLLAPRMSMWPYVVARYMMPALPGLLICVALGLLTQGRWLAEGLTARSTRAAQRAPALCLGVVALLVFALALVGPLPAVYRRHNSFTNHPDYYTPPGPQLVAQEVPAFYGFLAALPEPVEVLEAPDTRLFFLTIYGFYQNLHRNPVRTVSAAAALANPLLRLHSVVPAARVRELDFDYLIVHRSLASEFQTVSPFSNARRDRNFDSESPAFSEEGFERVQRYDRWAKQLLKLLDRDPRLQRVWEERWIVVYAGNPEAVGRVEQWRRPGADG